MTTIRKILKNLFVILVMAGMHAEYQFGSFNFLGQKMRFSSVELVIAFSTVLLFAFLLIDRSKIEFNLFDKNFNYILIFFLSSLILSSLFAYNRIESYKYIIRIFSVVSLSYLLSVFLYNMELVDFGIGVLKIVALLASIVGFLEVYNDDFKIILYNLCGWGIGSRRGSATSFFMHNNIFGCWMVCMFWFVVSGLFKKSNSLIKFCNFFLLFLSVYMIILSSSRNAWVSGLISALVFIKIKSRDKRKQVVVFIAAFVFSFFCVLSYDVPRHRVMQTINEIVKYEHLYKGDNTRVKLFHDSIKMFMDKPIFGVGVNNFKELYNVYGHHPGAPNKDLTAHNLWFQYLSEIGAFGFSALLILTIYLVKLVFFNVRNKGNVGFAMALFVLLLTSLFDYMWMDYSYLFIFWFVVSLNLLEKHRIEIQGQL